MYHIMQIQKQSRRSEQSLVAGDGLRRKDVQDNFDPGGGKGWIMIFSIFSQTGPRTGPDPPGFGPFWILI